MHITTSYNIHNKSPSSVGLVTPIQIYYYETLLEKWVPPPNVIMWIFKIHQERMCSARGVS